MSILNLLEHEEGNKEKPYLCSNGYPTVGIGQKLGPKCSAGDLHHYYQFKVPKDVARLWCRNHALSLVDEMCVYSDLQQAFSVCNDARRAILISMAYQLGIAGLRKFKITLNAIRLQEWETAAREMMDSKWARDDSPSRARRHAEQMRTGVWLKEYL